MWKTQIVYMFVLFLSTSLFSQEALRVDNANTTLTIDGTSTLHDWTVFANRYEGSAILSIEAQRLLEIQELNFAVVTKNLEGGKTTMNDQIMEALKEHDFPLIKFKLTKVESIKQSVDGIGFIIRSDGDLTIGGVTISEKLKVYSLVRIDGSVQFKGDLKIPMSKYSIEPPSTFMGTIKTDNEVVVRFSVVYN